MPVKNKKHLFGNKLNRPNFVNPVSFKNVCLLVAGTVVRVLRINTSSQFFKTSLILFYKVLRK